MGDRALLVDCADLAEVHGLHAALTARPLPGQGEVVPAARTLLVLLTDPGAAPVLAEALATAATAEPASVRQREVVLDVVYDGDDLADVAGVRGGSPDAVVRWHTGTPWTAAFLGFAPGFAYLVRDEPDGAPTDVPRRATPRTTVPAGAVALAGPYSAVYPRASPGGWRLIGRTSAVLWDGARADDPALLHAGTRVRFRAVRAQARAATPAAGRADPPTPAVPSTAVPADPSTPAVPPTAVLAVPAAPPDRAAHTPASLRAVEVLRPGPQALVEDLGRPRHRALGVGVSGAVDRGAAVRANRLVGNPRTAAVVECVLGGLELRAHGDLVLAVTGAPAPAVVRTPDGTARDRPAHATPFALHDGRTLVLEPPATGLRSYVAVRGGLGAAPVLGSRSTDVLSGLGPPPLAPGDVVGVLPPPPDAVAAWGDPPSPAPGDVVRVRVHVGPRSDHLTAPALRLLLTQDWTVTAESNRVGLRLAGEPLERTAAGELPSEGMVAGAVQVPPSGLPVLFLADHPVTGGYPVVAVVRDADLDLLAQVRPGDRLRLVDDPGTGAVPLPAPPGAPGLRP
ncbi:5-oxoprolinase/urea amidolyase family protein [Cellulomonas aerilata]|uniref:Allophanate hydrolase n=1 Tax=Cellulomonas aerilata TaxID=515326 RepID=A0A512DFN9_9CELL|nr:5-oxoprolinase/urea amidolyase family protein [Cellulomonas aerilata]GEO35298.1 hypothetical protein CAE01nite_30230 [Cellulomonas aerilata]